MKVKDVIASALRLIGRPELIPDLSKPSSSGEDDSNEVIETLLYCFNAVEDELAHKYIPLVTREEIISPDKRYFYTTFQRHPVKIKKVKSLDGDNLKFEVFALYMATEAKEIIVEYEYAPRPKNLDGMSDYDDEVGEYLIALGIASEYCVINGEAERADGWEKKYRARLDGVQSALPVCSSIPPRRWI